MYYYAPHLVDAVWVVLGLQADGAELLVHRPVLALRVGDGVGPSVALHPRLSRVDLHPAPRGRMLQSTDKTLVTVTTMTIVKVC